MTNPPKTLGNSTLQVGRIGLGCMGMSEFYAGALDEAGHIKALHSAIDLGGNHFDTTRRYTMTEILINIPEKLHQKVCEVSKMNNIPIDEIIAASLANKLHRIIPNPYLEERAKRATGEGFSIVLSQVPDIPPEEYDKL